MNWAQVNELEPGDALMLDYVLDSRSLDVEERWIMLAGTWLTFVGHDSVRSGGSIRKAIRVKVLRNEVDDLGHPFPPRMYDEGFLVWGEVIYYLRPPRAKEVQWWR